jgi:hypothetical protein
VCDAYGWPHDLSDEQILERLLALNLERAAMGGAVGKDVAATDEEMGEGADDSCCAPPTMLIGFCFRNTLRSTISTFRIRYNAVKPLQVYAERRSSL